MSPVVFFLWENLQRVVLYIRSSFSVGNPRGHTTDVLGNAPAAGTFSLAVYEYHSGWRLEWLNDFVKCSIFLIKDIFIISYVYMYQRLYVIAQVVIYFIFFLALYHLGQCYPNWGPRTPVGTQHRS